MAAAYRGLAHCSNSGSFFLRALFPSPFHRRGFRRLVLLLSVGGHINGLTPFRNPHRVEVPNRLALIDPPEEVRDFLPAVRRDEKKDSLPKHT